MYHIVFLIKSGYWSKDSHINIIEISGINLHAYGQMIFDKVFETVQCGKEQCFEKWYWGN